MKSLSRREFIKGIAGLAGATALTAVAGGSALAESNGAATYIPGTYSATAVGMGKVVVTMTFDETSITDIQLDVAEETDAIGQAAAASLIEQLKANQTAEIDGVSGASITSTAVRKAAASCIAQAKGLETATEKAAVSTVAEISDAELVDSAVELGEISNAADDGEYDIIVIGAGTAGVPCAVKAYQGGAKVLVLQKEPNVVAQGNTCTGFVLDESDDAAVLNVVHEVEENCTWRSDREQLMVYAYNSGEAVQWYYDEAVASGYPAKITPAETNSPDFGKLSKISVRGQGKPDNTGTVMTSIMAAYEDKLDIRYSTPAVQLIREGDRVTGVFAKDESGNYYRFSAKKGVILATGDYQNNEAMVSRYCPDVLNFDKKQYHKTGDGQLMGIAVGAKMEPIGHTKMIHDFDSGTMFNEPFLQVDSFGKRFHNESMDMSFINNHMRNYEKGRAGKYAQIFDADYFEQATAWGGAPTPEEGMMNYMPEEDVEHKGVMVELIATYKADTVEELAEKLGLPADELKASIDRYNELVDLGYDADYGKNPKYMQKIEKAPFWGIKKNIRVSALCSGVLINKDFEVLDEDRKPIEGLYAIGNCSGGFYGSPDYPLNVPGLSIGRCVTAGYVLAKALTE